MSIYIHAIADAQFIDNIIVLAWFDTKLAADIGHIDLKPLYAAIRGISPDSLYNG